jgi:hypothetical protein
MRYFIYDHNNEYVGGFGQLSSATVYATRMCVESWNHCGNMAIRVIADWNGGQWAVMCNNELFAHIVQKSSNIPVDTRP